MSAAGACVLAIALVACDSRPQKPKVRGFAPIGVAAAQQSDLVVPPAAISGAIAPVDEAFIRYAASSGLTEIEGARLVLKTTRSPELRGYAEKLMREHTRSIETLARLASARGLSLPSAPTGRHADMLTKFSGVALASRDDVFLQRFGIDAHKETIALFERHTAEARDPEVKRYALESLTLLREHMAAAYKLIHAAADR
jgi:putative membrane protein